MDPKLGISVKFGNRGKNNSSDLFRYLGTDFIPHINICSYTTASVGSYQRAVLSLRIATSGQQQLSRPLHTDFNHNQSVLLPFISTAYTPPTLTSSSPHFTQWIAPSSSGLSRCASATTMCITRIPPTAVDLYERGRFYHTHCLQLRVHLPLSLLLNGTV